MVGCHCGRGGGLVRLGGKTGCRQRIVAAHVPDSGGSLYSFFLPHRSTERSPYTTAAHPREVETGTVAALRRCAPRSSQLPDMNFELGFLIRRPTELCPVPARCCRAPGTPPKHRLWDSHNTNTSGRCNTIAKNHFTTMQPDHAPAFAFFAGFSSRDSASALCLPVTPALASCTSSLYAFSAAAPSGVLTYAP